MKGVMRTIEVIAQRQMSYVCNSCKSEDSSEIEVVTIRPRPNSSTLPLVNLADELRQHSASRSLPPIPLGWATYPGDVHICPACQAKRQPPINQEK